MRRGLACIVLAWLLTGCPGCMWLVCPAKYDVTVQSAGRPACVRADTGPVLMTPATFELSRGDDHDIALLADGEVVKTYHIASEGRGGRWFLSVIMNCAAWWITGWGPIAGVFVDYESGALNVLVPDRVTIEERASRDPPPALALTSPIVAPPGPPTGGGATERSDPDREPQDAERAPRLAAPRPPPAPGAPRSR